jgi:hypothetical protein
VGQTLLRERVVVSKLCLRNISEHVTVHQLVLWVLLTQLSITLAGFRSTHFNEWN